MFKVGNISYNFILKCFMTIKFNWSIKWKLHLLISDAQLEDLCEQSVVFAPETQTGSVAHAKSYAISSMQTPFILHYVQKKHSKSGSHFVNLILTGNFHWDGGLHLLLFWKTKKFKWLWVYFFNYFFNGVTMTSVSFTA